MRPIAIFIFLMLAGQAADGFAETPNLQMMEGKSIRILLRDTGEMIKGRFHEAIKDSLVMTRPKGILGRKQRLTIAFSDISKLEVHKYHKSSVKKGGILGALTGAIVGIALVSQTLDSDGIGLSGNAYFIVPPMFALGGGLGGAFVGGLFSYHVWEDIDLSPSTAVRGDQRLSFRLSFRF